MLQAYVDHVAERAALGIPPLPLSAKQTSELIELIKTAGAKDGEFLLNLLTNRVPAGVDDAAKVKASYLAAVAHGTETTLLLGRARATERRQSRTARETARTPETGPGRSPLRHLDRRRFLARRRGP